MLDISYIAYFPAYQHAALQHVIRDINKHHDPTLIGDFATLFETGNAMSYASELELLQPEQVLSTGDILTLAGLTRSIDCIRGAVSPWRYITSGGGTTTTPAVTNTALEAETGPRIDMADANFGWREQYGMKIFYGGMYGEKIGSNITSELGIFSASSAGTMLNRSAFPYASILRNQNNQFNMYVSVAVYAVVVEFCPALP